MLALAVGIGLLGSASLADQHRPKKPNRPMIAIDNEGPIAVIRHLRTHSDDHDRRGMDDEIRLLPWRPVIRLDLILPIRTGPWSPPPRRRPG
jgi:hypothetical protein